MEGEADATGLTGCHSCPYSQEGLATSTTVTIEERYVALLDIVDKLVDRNVQNQL